MLSKLSDPQVLNTEKNKRTTKTLKDNLKTDQEDCTSDISGGPSSFASTHLVR